MGRVMYFLCIIGFFGLISHYHEPIRMLHHWLLDYDFVEAVAAGLVGVLASF